MLGKRTRPTSSTSTPSPHPGTDAPLNPPKRPLTAHLGSTKSALASPNASTKWNASNGAVGSCEMRRQGSQKENFVLAAIPAAVVEDKKQDMYMNELEMEQLPPAFTDPLTDDLFDVLPLVPASTPSTTTSDSRSIPHIYAHASLLLSTSSSLSSSLPLEGRTDQRETLQAFLTRRFPAMYASPDGPSTSTPTRPGPASMYVSGPPGIGKTALLASVINAFEAQVEEKELGGDVKVWMENCATVSSAGVEGAWERLAKGLGIEDVGDGAKRKGKERFEEGLKDGRKYLLILDEIDHLVSPTSTSSRSSTSAAPDLLNSLFSLASTPASPLTLIGIANDLTLKALSLTPTVSPATTPTKSGKGKARLDPLHTPTKPIRLHFKPYSWQELVSIVAQRLALLAPSYPHLPTAELPSPAPTPSAAPMGKPTYPLIATPALDRLCKKIASTTGDVRTVLSLTRQTILSSQSSSLSPSDLAALTPSSAPKAGMPHLSKALSAASYAGSGLGPAPTLKSRLTALQAGPHHRLVLCACVVALSRAIGTARGEKIAGLDASAVEAQAARVTLEDAFKAYKDVVLPSCEALKATRLDQGAFGETVGMVEDLCGAVVVRGRPGAGGSPNKGGSAVKRTPTKRAERGKVTVEFSQTAPLPDLLAALTEAPKPGSEDKEEEPVRLARRVLERERSDQRWKLKRWELGRDEERRAEEELEGREWERRVVAAEEDGGKA
ncbi:hypothetical protein JCM11251_000614 [Rhodosporidiobolus azoricus]